MSAYRTISESTTVTDTVQRFIETFRKIAESLVAITDAVIGSWGTQRNATAYLTKLTADSSITKLTASVELTEN